jgi:iron complex outermembrane recepter protein
MKLKGYRCYLFALLLFLAAFFILGNSAMHAQTKQIVTWLDDLKSLQSASREDLLANRAAVEQIRNGIELWIKMHPDSKIALPPAAATPWGAEEIGKQVNSLRKALESILKEDKAQPFNLGMTEVSVTAEASPLSPVADTIDRTEIENRQALTVASALDYLPGMALDISAVRNETQIRLNGFSNRGQVPLYIDGIPSQVAYDGTIDFGRFLTSDIAEIQVAKGFSSPLLGPNALGGSVNLVTRAPERKFEGDALIGTGTGDQLLSSVHLGSRFEKFYVQGSVDWLQRNYIPISGDFPLQAPTATSPRYQTTYDRNRSNSRDEKYSGRVGFTPKGEDEYVFSYINQKGEKGVPLYAGPNLNASNRYWDWPYWNKNSYYFISNTGIGKASSIKFRLFYDQFRNALATNDDDTYLTMKNYPSKGLKPGMSYYDDRTGGASSEFTTRILPRNAISASFFFKDDMHKDHSYFPGKPLLTPTLLDRAQQFSIGFQDIITVTSRLRATFGFSADYMKGLQAETFNSTQTGLQWITCPSSPNNNTASGCTARVWNYNPQASVSYSLTNEDTFFLTFADRGRFPLLKESYSYKLGSGIPNPELEPEHSRNWNAGYSHALGSAAVAQIEYFRSDLRDAIQSAYVADIASQCSNTGIYAGLCSQYFNIGKEVHEGMNLSIRSTPFSRLTLDIIYSYLNRTIAYDFSDRPDVDQTATLANVLTLSSMPKNKLIANASLRLPHRILAIADYRYEGGIFLQDTTYSTPMPAYGGSFGTVDMGTVVPIPFGAGITLQAGLKNLFDRNYYLNAGYPETGRSWYLNMRYRFGAE